MVLDFTTQKILSGKDRETGYKMFGNLCCNINVEINRNFRLF